VENSEVEQIAMSQLESGERLLWSGSPSPGAMAMSGLPVSLFGVPFLAFACFWIWGAWTGVTRGGHAPGPFLFFPLFGVPFVLVGLGLVAAPLFAYLGARQTVYAVTDKRAFILVGLGVKNVRSFYHADVGELTRFEKADGSGTLWFAKRLFTTSSGVNTARIGFVGIPNVRQVEQLIRDNLVEAKAA